MNRGKRRPPLRLRRMGLRKDLAALLAVATVLLLALFAAQQWIYRTMTEPQQFYPAVGDEAGDKRVILLLADRLTYPDLLGGAGPHLSRLLKQGAVALMNVRSGRAGSESGYLSLGTAARAAAGPEGGSAFERGELVEGEKAEVVFKRCTGKEPAGALFHLQTAALRERNSALPYPVTVGLLGEKLRARGLNAAVWGSADGALHDRSAVMVAMNGGGEVHAGAVGEDLLQEAPFFPYGVRTDIAALTTALAADLKEAALHVVEFGDSSRLDDYWPQLDPDRGETILHLTMERLDLLAGELLSLLGEGDALLLAVPSLPQNRLTGGGELTPLILFTPGGSTPGLFGSASTRRPGLVQNTDLPSLVLFLLGGGHLAAPAASFTITRSQQEEGAAFLERFDRHAAQVFEQRPPLLKIYIALLVAVLLAALVALLRKILRVLQPLTCFIGVLLSVPPALLLLPGLLPFPHSTAAFSGLILALAASLFALLMWLPTGGARPLPWAVLGWCIALLLLIDTLIGAPLQQLSLFSYDPVGGARYYGMGNEYAGVLIGATLLGTVSLFAFCNEPRPPEESRRVKKVQRLLLPAIALFYAMIIFVLAAPNFGANLGGCLTAAVAFGVSWAGLSGAAGGASLSRKRILISAALFLLIAAGLLWLLNIRSPGLPPSHIGRFGEMVRLRGPAGFWETVLRKLNMNLKLMRYSAWSRAFVTLVGLCALLSVYPGGLMKRMLSEQPYLITGVSAALAGAAAALLTNDSGVVAAATLLLYAVPPALVAVLQKNLHRERVYCHSRQD